MKGCFLTWHRHGPEKSVPAKVHEVHLSSVGVLIASLRTISESSSVLWRLYCKSSSGPLQTLPMRYPGLYSSMVKCSSRPATESGLGYGGIVQTRNKRNGGLTSTANVVGNITC